MKNFFAFLVICFACNKGFCQLEFKNSNLGRTMEFVDQNGQSLLKTYDPDIGGSPFINPDWALAKITLSSGKTAGSLPVKLNIVNNELYFRDSTGTELIALPAMVKKVDCVSAYWKDNVRFLFKNGYPQVDEQNENFYYQVLAEGNVELLLKAYKYIRVEKNDLSGQVSKEFVEGSKLYIYANNTMRLLQPNKTFILSLMKDNEQAANNFAETNKLNFKKTADLIKLFTYYNSLPK